MIKHGSPQTILSFKWNAPKYVLGGMAALSINIFGVVYYSHVPGLLKETIIEVIKLFEIIYPQRPYVFCSARNWHYI